MLVWHRSISCHSACGIAWHYICRGNVAEVPPITPTKWYFRVCTAFSEMLRRWSSGSTSWYVTFFSPISATYAVDISLSKTWCLGTMPCFFILASILRRAPIRSPSVWWLVVSISVQLLSTWWATTMYWCQRLDLTRNFPVWSVYMVCVWSYTLMKMSLISSVVSLIVGDSWASGELWDALQIDFLLADLVLDRVFLCRLLMCPFCVYLDSGKYLFTCFTLIRGHETKVPLRISFSHVVLVVKPAAPWR